MALVLFGIVNVTTSVNEVPLISFFKRLLDPLMINGVLYLLTLIWNEPFTGYYLVLAIIGFFIATSIYEQLDPARSWRSGNVWAYCREILSGWLMFAICIYFIGYASGLAYHFSHEVMLWWFGVTPFALVGSHMALRKITSDLRKRGEIRSAVIVGANDISVKLAGRFVDYPNLFMELGGYFEDRALERLPSNLSAPILGKMADAAAYVRAHNIKTLFISLPMSAQPRIQTLLDDLQDTTVSIYFLPHANCWRGSKHCYVVALRRQHWIR